jgi:alpha,alpha-trehalose phosphorylase
MASLAGAWIALVAGFGGMRVNAGELSFAPYLSDQLSRLAFHLRFRHRRLRVTVTHEAACYELLDHLPLTVRHYGEPVSLGLGARVERPIPSRPRRPPPTQPAGRAPEPRHAQRAAEERRPRTP